MNRLQLSSSSFGRRWVTRRRPLRLASTPQHDPRRWPISTSDKDTFDTLATLPSSSSMQTPVAQTGPRTATNVTATRADATGGNSTPSSSQATYMGVTLPVKPQPPGPEGCATCVYDIYLDSVETYHVLVTQAKSKVLDKLRHERGDADWERAPVGWPVDVFGDWDPSEGHVSEAGTAKTTEEAKRKAEKELERTRSTLDPALR
ncbi:hypothetical protein OIV83_006131 [Microbotryomycetes sp. JL201]|nr:hypothetical protein OIV83_006131 [Microbotryomycetes sp. JL201]